MSAIYYLRYKGGFLMFHDGVRKVTRVSLSRHATPFTSEAEVWLAARRLHLDSDFVEVVPASAINEELPPAVTAADATKPAVQSSKLTSAAVSVALVLFFTLAGNIGAQGTRGVVAPANQKKVAAHLSPPGQRRQVPTAKFLSAILGEASDQGTRGMLAVACALRNRGSLRGVYGVSNPVIAQASPALRAQALAAWRKSATTDITGGATHWGNLRDIQTAKFYSRLTFTVKIGGHYFFKTPSTLNSQPS